MKNFTVHYIQHFTDEVKTDKLSHFKVSANTPEEAMKILKERFCAYYTFVKVEENWIFSLLF